MLKLLKAHALGTGFLVILSLACTGLKFAGVAAPMLLIQMVFACAGALVIGTATLPVAVLLHRLCAAVRLPAVFQKHVLAAYLGAGLILGVLAGLINLALLESPWSHVMMYPFLFIVLLNLDTAYHYFLLPWDGLLLFILIVMPLVLGHYTVFRKH